MKIYSCLAFEMVGDCFLGFGVVFFFEGVYVHICIWVCTVKCIESEQFFLREIFHISR